MPHLRRTLCICRYELFVFYVPFFQLKRHCMLKVTFLPTIKKWSKTISNQNGYPKNPWSVFLTTRKNGRNSDHNSEVVGKKRPPPNRVVQIFQPPSVVFLATWWSENLDHLFRDGRFRSDHFQIVVGNTNHLVVGKSNLTVEYILFSDHPIVGNNK